MEKEEELFEKLKKIVDQLEDQKSKRGENFNIFTVTNLTENENNLHSAFIAELLNPKGSHGLGIQPLKSFLLLIGENSFSEEEIKNAIIKTNYYIGRIKEEKGNPSGGFIDILIEVGNTIIVIENKIYAPDQPKQMERYHNYCASRTDKKYRLLYLTLDRHLPSEDSRGDLKVDEDYHCISYFFEITRWIKECISFASTFPLVRETLVQYLHIVLTLTYQDMDNKNNETFLELMYEHSDVVAQISKKLTHNEYMKYIISKYFVEKFNEWCKENNFECFVDDSQINITTGICFGIYKKDWKKMIALDFEKQNFQDCAFGVYKWKSEDKRTDYFMKDWKDNDSSWPCGWEYFDKYRNWNAFIVDDLKNGNLIEDISYKINDLIERLNKRSFPML